jgi:hypothetical protein
MTILTNPNNPEQTWTSGVFRGGAMPKWAKEMVAANPSLIPPKEEVVKAKSITYVHPEDSSLTHTTGGDARKTPQWVKLMIAGKPLPSLVKKEFVISKQEDDTVLKYWVWRDYDGKPQGGCIVGAYTEKEALKLLNAVFKYCVSQIEFDSCWKEVDSKDVLLNNRTGVFQKNKSNEWEARPVLNKVYVKGMVA